LTSASLRLQDYDFELPSDAIAQRPCARRADSRLLCWNADGSYDHAHFSEIARRLRPGDLLVLNDTRVFPARLFGQKIGGSAEVEALLLRPMAGGAQEWEAMIRPGRRMRPGSVVEFGGGARATVGEDFGDGRRSLTFGDGTDVWALCEHQGHVPLPPYIARPDCEDDADRYQTVFARDRGSVAAPTAGLHFDEILIRALRDGGVEIVSVTLHIGPGTFQPLDESRLARGELHPEEITVSAQTLESLRQQRARGGRIVGVGTTVCRALESILPERMDTSEAEPLHMDTRLMIQPGHGFRWVDVLITNFHLPQSSLLLLVAALAGPRWREAYALAIEEGYRFYSYGDANWIERRR
jgi:S-adenosylmethionine:tRNA ribosyltransferase-isomerase